MGREKLSGILLVCYDGLKVYGKEPEQLENLIALFQMILADYTIGDIEKAFRSYMLRNSEMPAPSDIAQIIDRGGKPPFERSVYVAMTKKHPEDRTSGDWEYIRDYERFAQTGRL